ncbi:RNA-binding protein Jag [Lachnospiraceae bacterium TWA4]|nr:RNA-binding protein Jag [Lachnospiraceae bacterium TWA4]
MNTIEVSAKTVEDALTQALIKLETTSDKIKYEVIDKGSSGLFGIGRRPVIIKAWVNEEKPVEEAKVVVEPTVVKEAPTQKIVEETTSKKAVATTPEDFLQQVCNAMGLDVTVDSKMNEEEKTLDINLVGQDMGILIGKRGQTLDSLQYLTGLIVNKNEEEYIRVKLDTENYRERRKETLENLAKNIALKVKKTRRPVSLEPMNPYERRVIHSALQNDKFVVTRSEGEEPYRHIVISLKRERSYNPRTGSGRNGYGRYNNSYRSNNGQKGKYREYNRNFDKNEHAEGSAVTTEE